VGRSVWRSMKVEPADRIGGVYYSRFFLSTGYPRRVTTHFIEIQDDRIFYVLKAQFFRYIFLALILLSLTYLPFNLTV
jgi:hypothetical protein